MAKNKDEQKEIEQQEQTGRTEQPTQEQQEAAAQAAAAAQQAATSQPAQPQPTLQQTIKVDDSEAMASYANFCRVSSTPEELILDLGLNPNPFATGEVTVKVAQRVIMNYYTAKRLLAALSAALQRHEQIFGVLETDVRRRIRTR